jgi:hypothetical protein
MRLTFSSLQLLLYLLYLKIQNVSLHHPVYSSIQTYVLLFILEETPAHGVKLLMCEVDHLHLLPKFKMLGDSPLHPLCFHIIETCLTLIIITSDVTPDPWLKCGCQVCGRSVIRNIQFYIIR